MEEDRVRQQRGWLVVDKNSRLRDVTVAAQASRRVDFIKLWVELHIARTETCFEPDSTPRPLNRAGASAHSCSIAPCLSAVVREGSGRMLGLDMRVRCTSAPRQALSIDNFVRTIMNRARRREQTNFQLPVALTTIDTKRRADVWE